MTHQTTTNKATTYEEVYNNILAAKVIRYRFQQNKASIPHDDIVVVRTSTIYIIYFLVR